MTKTSVNLGANGQYKTTVPKDLADGFDLEGKKFEWRVKSGKTIELTICDA